MTKGKNDKKQQEQNEKSCIFIDQKRKFYEMSKA